MHTKESFYHDRKIKGSLCFAPSTSMYIGYQGEITACCINKKNVLGRYPEESLMKIWTGEKYKKMREELRSFVFSDGCRKCERLISNNNFATLKIPFHDRTTPNNFNLPERLYLELDNKCNLMCTMCSGKFSSKILKHIERKPEYKSPYLNDNFLDELKPFLMNAHYIDYYGGEPFLIGIYYKIWEFLIKENINSQQYIQTNGTVYNKKISDIVTNLNVNLSISLDSVNEDTYSKIRIGSNYNLVIDNLLKFNQILKNKNKNLYISAVLCKDNFKELMEFYFFCQKNQLILYFHELNRPRNLSVYNVEYDDLKNFLLEINKKIQNIRKISNIDLINLETIISQIKFLEKIKLNLENTKDSNFSFINFIEKHFPYYLKITKDKLAESQVTDFDVSNSIEFKTINACEETGISNHLFKEILPLTEEQYAIKISEFFLSLKKL